MSELSRLAKRMRDRDMLDRTKGHVSQVVKDGKKPNRAARRDYERRVRAMVTRAPFVGAKTENPTKPTAGTSV